MIEHEQFSEFSESHLLPSMFDVLPRGKTIQLTSIFNVLKIKWYFSDIAVSFNFLVIGIDSFDKNILKML